MSLSGAVCRSVQSDLSPYMGIVTGVSTAAFTMPNLSDCLWPKVANLDGYLK